MAKCKNCKHLKRYHEISKGKEREYDLCVAYNCHPCIEAERDCDVYECMTNADRIRAMSDEELAEFLDGGYGEMGSCDTCKEPRNEYGSCSGYCRNEYLRWLKSEVEET